MSNNSNQAFRKIKVVQTIKNKMKKMLFIKAESNDVEYKGIIKR